MFSKKKKKPELKEVKMCLWGGRHTNQQKVYGIPEGGTAKITTIGQDLLIYDKDKNLILEVEPQAGYTVEYYFTYKEFSEED